MWVRCLKNFEHHTQRGVAYLVKAGELVDVLNRHELKRLTALGLVGPIEESHLGLAPSSPAEPFKRTKRIGLWQKTSKHYSGGRIFLYQYAWAMASLGAEVWLVTDDRPRWAADYPEMNRLHVAIEGRDKLPPDFDIIMTDSKGALGTKALKFKQNHPGIPFVCVNFETPNFIQHFEPKYASRVEANKATFQAADLLIAISEECQRYLLEWVEKDIPSSIITPIVNTFAVKASESHNVQAPNRPFAVYSARGADYKKGSLVYDAIWSLDIPFDLVVFGGISRPPKETPLHKLHEYRQRPDVEKYALMRKASLVLAPSTFEGYGMVPGEALSVGTQPVVFDLPVLREAYGDKLVYVPWNDGAAFKAKIKELAPDPPKVSAEVVTEIHRTKGFEAMKAQIETVRFHAMQRKSVSAHMVAYWGYFPESIQSIYDHVEEIIVAYGPTKHGRAAADAAGLDPDNPDGSLELLENTPDPEGKIKIEVRPEWADKRVMRTWATSRMGGNYHLLLDGDEIHEGFDKWLAVDLDFACPRWVHLWHSGEFWIYDSAKEAGKRWGKPLKPFGSLGTHYRFSFWRPSYCWPRHAAPKDAAGNPIHVAAPEAVNRAPGSVIYHLGHILNPRLMKMKHEFYKRRDGNDRGRQNRERCWHKWNGQPGYCGDGHVARVTWDLPELVQSAIARVQEPAEVEV